MMVGIINIAIEFLQLVTKMDISFASKSIAGNVDRKIAHLMGTPWVQ